MLSRVRIILLFCGVVLALAGCTGVPVAVTYLDHSLTGSGASSQDQSSFSFLVSDQRVSCRGSYNLAPAFGSKFKFPISCSDGRRGSVEATRLSQPVDKAGQDFPVTGKIIFTDGEIGMFNLGEYARNLNTNSINYREFIEDAQSSTVK